MRRSTMDDTIFQLLTDGFFDPDPDDISCDNCISTISGQYYHIDGKDYCLKCVDGDQ